MYCSPVYHTLSMRRNPNSWKWSSNYIANKQEQSSVNNMNILCRIHLPFLPRSPLPSLNSYGRLSPKLLGQLPRILINHSSPFQSIFAVAVSLAVFSPSRESTISTRPWFRALPLYDSPFFVLFQVALSTAMTFAAPPSAKGRKFATTKAIQIQIKDTTTQAIKN